jgi:hypothetical protein
MLSFKQFVTELAREDVIISPTEIEEMRHRFGDKVLQMGHLNQDHSTNVPIDCIVEAARSLEPHALTEAAEIINNGQLVSMLHAGETLVERIAGTSDEKLRRMIRSVQNNGDDRQWKQIKKEIFGVDFND